MTIRSLAEVDTCLRIALERYQAGTPSPQDAYDIAEALCFDALDSQHADFPDGQLEEYLATWLRLRQMEMGIVEDDLV